MKNFKRSLFLVDFLNNRIEFHYRLFGSFLKVQRSFIAIYSYWTSCKDGKLVCTCCFSCLLLISFITFALEEIYLACLIWILFVSVVDGQLFQNVAC